MYINNEVIKMNATMQIKDGYYQIKIPIQDSYEDDYIRDFLDFFKAEQILSKSKATDEFINDLANEVKSSWWKANKKRFIK